MPVRSLCDSFVKEFSWLAVHPDGRRTWDSVYERSKGFPYMRLNPPPLVPCAMEFRSVRMPGQWLVLEILHAAGKKVPCDVLRYSHPSLRSPVTVKVSGGTRGNGRPRTGSGSAEFLVDSDGSGTRTSISRRCTSRRRRVPSIRRFR
jgi:hypothetical protein